MKKNELLLILIAGLLFLTGCSANEFEPNPNIDCSELNEEECFRESSCRGNYGSSSCSGMICTADFVFHSCSTIPDKVLQEAKQEKQVCDDTGGKWNRDRTNEPGRCQCKDEPYFENEGCVSVAEDCERVGGTFYEPETLECTDQLRDIHSWTCRFYDPRFKRFNEFPECICSNGDIWDYYDRCVSETSLTSKINETLKVRWGAEEVSKPYFELPENVEEGQISKYFKLDDIYFALVLQSSMNFALELPENFKTTYSGILIAFKGDKKWQKFIKIQDGPVSIKNNPYYLWVEDRQLRLTVVDQNGAGSGEGMLKSFKLLEEGVWELDGCYYFGLSYNGPDIDGDHFEFSTHFEKHQEKPIEECEDVTLINY